MQQLYRAIFEISELSIVNMIKTAIWQSDFISFELFLENKELKFYVVTLPYYQSIIEKQITSFYPNANIFKEYLSPVDVSLIFVLVWEFERNCCDISSLSFICSLSMSTPRTFL